MQHPPLVAQLVQTRSLELAARAKNAEHHFALEAKKDTSSRAPQRPTRRFVPWWLARANRPRAY